MPSGLEHLLAEGIISEVVARLQSGKEAEVYVVRFGGKVVAAKVYKERDHRSFRNNAAYKEGRAVRNTRSQRAMASGSRFGKAASEDAWKSAEADALYRLHAAEVRVPAPVLFLDGVLLMELVLDAEGNAARRVIETDLTASQANAAYKDMVTQLVRMLSCDLIHGDLSPYNVLWGAAGPTVIDFPQIVSASHNSSSERFFLRDAENILGHFARIDRSLDPYGDAREIWHAYRTRELTPEFQPTGRGRSLGGPPRGERAFAPRGPGGHPGQAAHGGQGSRPHGGQGGQGGHPNGGRPPPGRPFGGGGPRRPPGPEVIVRPRMGAAPEPPAGSPSAPPAAPSAPRPAPSHTSPFPPQAHAPRPHNPRPAHTTQRDARPTERRAHPPPQRQGTPSGGEGERHHEGGGEGGARPHRRRRRRRH